MAPLQLMRAMQVWPDVETAKSGLSVLLRPASAQEGGREINQQVINDMLEYWSKPLSMLWEHGCSPRAPGDVSPLLKKVVGRVQADCLAARAYILSDETAPTAEHQGRLDGSIANLLVRSLSQGHARALPLTDQYRFHLRSTSTILNAFLLKLRQSWKAVLRRELCRTGSKIVLLTLRTGCKQCGRLFSCVSTPIVSDSSLSISRDRSETLMLLSHVRLLTFVACDTRSQLFLRRRPTFHGCLACLETCAAVLTNNHNTQDSFGPLLPRESLSWAPEV